MTSIEFIYCLGNRCADADNVVEGDKEEKGQEEGQEEEGDEKDNKIDIKLSSYKKVSTFLVSTACTCTVRKT